MLSRSEWNFRQLVNLVRTAGRHLGLKGNAELWQWISWICQLRHADWK